MAQILKTALVMYSTDEIYRLVNDVAAYPEFLPHCSDSKILVQTDKDMTASLEISKAGINKWFTTQNRLVDGQSVEMTLVDGPFKKLVGGWTFTALDEYACKITLQLDFEFSSKIIEMAFGKVFKEVANNMISAFSQRAKHVYGERVL